MVAMRSSTWCCSTTNPAPSASSARHFWTPPAAITSSSAVFKRAPWHVCAIRRELAVKGIFPDINDGEDRAWLEQVRPHLKTETHIDAVLHHYRFDSKLTAATGH